MPNESNPTVWYCIDDLESAEAREISEEIESMEADLAEVERIANDARENENCIKGSYSTT